MKVFRYFLITMLLASCVEHEPKIGIKEAEYGSILPFTDNQILQAAFQSAVGKQFLTPRNSGTIYFLKNVYTKDLISNRDHQAFVKATEKELLAKKTGYWIVDRIIYNSKYAVVAIYGNQHGYFTGIIRNKNGKLIATECNFIYDLFEYPRMKAKGYVN